MIYDVAVIGGGIAGGSAAIRLSRLGYSVLLLEKELHPAHKVCGEFLSGECQPLLQEVGIDFEEMGAAEIRSLLVAAGRAELQIDLPFLGRGISRKKLDDRLLTLASMRGTDVRRGVLVKGLNKTADRTEIDTSQGPMWARNLFWAIGKTEMRAILPRRGKVENFVGFKRHLKLPPLLADSLRGRVELHVFDGGYGGLSEVEDQFFNFCFILSKHLVKSFGQDWGKINDHQSQKNVRLRNIFSEAQWQWPRPLTIGHIPYGFEYENTLPEYFVIGDQFAVIPSLAGDGMAMSLFSAKEAVNAFHRASETGEEMRVAIEQYSSATQSTFYPPIRWGNRLQRVFQFPIVAKMAIRAIRPFPGITEKLIQQTRCFNFS